MDHRDALLSAGERASLLLSQMTAEEKVAQLAGVLPNAIGAPDRMTRDSLDAHLSAGIGHICAVGTAVGDAASFARFTNEVQRYLADHTRLAIPAILHNETLNGVQGEAFTSFPTAIGLAATWDPERVREMADLIRRQLRATGVRQALAPVLDVARDARWGRVHETYGEDVLLASVFGVAYVRGLQGPDLRDGVIATGKHFLGYSAAEGGQNMAASRIGPRELRDVHAAPFEAAIRAAGMRSVMNGYSEIDGAPVATSRALLTDLLREELGFDGTVVADYRSLFYAVHRQGAGDRDSVAEAALRAGLDVELPEPYAYGRELAERLARGEVDEADVDRAVHRALTHKFELGLFENPYAEGEPEELRALASSGRGLSREITDASVTLLKNNGALPLMSGLKSVAVIGPHADSVMSGFANYTYPPFLETLRGIVTGESRMAGMERALSNSDPEKQAEMRRRIEALSRLDPEAVARENYGAKTLADALGELLPDAVVATAPGVGVLDDEPSDVDQALKLAEDADLVVVALGGRSAAFAGRATEGEGSDSATLELPSCQVDLVERLAAVGKTMVGVLYMGKPYCIGSIEGRFDAVLTGYIPGPEGGAALASALVGKTNPSGKLPFTIPRHAGQVPLYYAQKVGSGQRRTPADQFAGYVNMENAPLYPFGHGLSYTTFEVSALSVVPPADTSGVIRGTVAVRNSGGAAGTEVVQIYASAPARLITRPERQLVAFARVDLAPGERRTVEFEVDMRQLGYTCEDGRFVVDPGEYTLRAGTSSEDLPCRVAVRAGGERTEVLEAHIALPRAAVTDAAGN